MASLEEIFKQGNSTSLESVFAASKQTTPQTLNKPTASEIFSSTMSGSTPSTLTTPPPSLLDIGKAVASGTYALGKGVVQGFLRGTAAAGGALAGLPRQVINTIKGSGDTSIGTLDLSAFDNTFEGDFLKSFYGTEQGKDKIGFGTEGAIFGVQENSPLAVGIGAVSSGLDLFGGGAAKESLTTLVKGLKLANDAVEAERLLKAAGFSEDIAKNASDVFAGLKDTKKIEEGLMSLQDLQNTTRQAGTSASEISRPLYSTSGSSLSIGTKAEDALSKISADSLPEVLDNLKMSPSNAINFTESDLSTIRSLYSKATTNASELFKIAEDAKIPDFKMDLKDPARVIEKISQKRLAKAYSANDIADIVRGFGVVKTPEQAAEIAGKIKGVLSTDDYFTKPTPLGFRGMNLNVKLADGAKVEIQLHTEASKKLWDALHTKYEDFRALYPNALDAPQSAIDEIRNYADNLYADAAKHASSVERGFVTTVKDAKPELATRVGGQYVPRSTDILAMKAANLIKDDIKTAETLARTGTSDKAVATAAELIKHYTEAARTATEPGVSDTLLDKAADIANDVARKLTEQGRAVQAASIMGRLTPEGVVRFAAREIQKYNEGIDVAKAKLGGFSPAAMRSKVPELTGEQISTLTKKALEIAKMPDGIKKAQAWHALNDEIAALVPSTLYKKIIAVWKAGLLTGIKTSGLNIASNLFHGVSEFAKDIPAAAVDSVASLITGKRTLALTGRGTGSGLMSGFAKGWHYLKTGFDERDIGAKLDYRKVNFGKGPVGKAIQAYEESIFRVIGAEDQPFYYGAKARSVMSQAIAAAKNEGLKGADAKKFITDLVENPTDEILKYATLDAETAVFQQSTALGKMAKGIQRLPGGEVAVPFGKTPAGVATQLLNYSPVGFVKTIAENIGKGRFDQRLFSQGIGRAVVGTGAMYLGTLLFKKGMVSLGYPATEAERQQWQAEGRTPNSILVDGKWRSVATLGPIGLTVVAGAYFQKGVEETGSFWGGLAASAAGGAKSLTEQTFLKGVNQIVDAITDPKRSAQSFFTGLIGSTIPTIVSDVARSTDGTERRTPGLLDVAKSRIPGVRQGLEPKVDSLGGIDKTESLLEVMADPTRPSTASKDPVILELRRLSDAGFQAFPTLLGDKEGYPAVLTPKQNTELWVNTGLLLKSKVEALMKTDAYQAMDDETKAKTLGTFEDKTKVIGRAQMVLELTTGLQGEALKQKLSELKAGKLLTQEVFKKYLEIR